MCDISERVWIVLAGDKKGTLVCAVVCINIMYYNSLFQLDWVVLHVHACMRHSY